MPKYFLKLLTAERTDKVLNEIVFRESLQNECRLYEAALEIEQVMQKM